MFLWLPIIQTILREVWWSFMYERSEKNKFMVYERISMRRMNFQWDVKERKIEQVWRGKGDSSSPASLLSFSVFQVFTHFFLRESRTRPPPYIFVVGRVGVWKSRRRLFWPRIGYVFIFPFNCFLSHFLVVYICWVVKMDYVMHTATSIYILYTCFYYLRELKEILA